MKDMKSSCEKSSKRKKQLKKPSERVQKHLKGMNSSCEKSSKRKKKTIKKAFGKRTKAHERYEKQLRTILKSKKQTKKSLRKPYKST